MPVQNVLDWIEEQSRKTPLLTREGDLHELPSFSLDDVSLVPDENGRENAPEDADPEPRRELEVSVESFEADALAHFDVILDTLMRKARMANAGTRGRMLQQIEDMRRTFEQESREEFMHQFRRNGFAGRLPATQIVGTDVPTDGGAPVRRNASGDHVAVLREPDGRRYKSYVRVQNEFREGVDAIYGIRRSVGPQGGRTELVMAYYDAGRWTPGEAESHANDLFGDDPGVIRVSEAEPEDVPRENPIRERMGPDEFATPEEAQRRAEEIGCEGIHSHQREYGKIYMPCKTHEGWRRATSRENPGWDDEDERKNVRRIPKGFTDVSLRWPAGEVPNDTDDVHSFQLRVEDLADEVGKDEPNRGKYIFPIRAPNSETMRFRFGEWDRALRFAMKMRDRLGTFGEGEAAVSVQEGSPAGEIGRYRRWRSTDGMEWKRFERSNPPVMVRDLDEEEMEGIDWTPGPELLAIFRRGGNALVLSEKGVPYEGPVLRDGTVDLTEFAPWGAEEIDEEVKRAIEAIKETNPHSEKESVEWERGEEDGLWKGRAPTGSIIAHLRHVPDGFSWRMMSEPEIAGIESSLSAAKEAVKEELARRNNPSSNFHTAHVRPSDDEKYETYRRDDDPDTFERGIHVLYGILPEGEEGPRGGRSEIVSIYYPSDRWHPANARRHARDAFDLDAFEEATDRRENPATSHSEGEGRFARVTYKKDEERGVPNAEIRERIDRVADVANGGVVSVRETPSGSLRDVFVRFDSENGASEFVTRMNEDLFEQGLGDRAVAVHSRPRVNNAPTKSGVDVVVHHPVGDDGLPNRERGDRIEDIAETHGGRRVGGGMAVGPAYTGMYDEHLRLPDEPSAEAVAEEVESMFEEEGAMGSVETARTNPISPGPGPSMVSLRSQRRGGGESAISLTSRSSESEDVIDKARRMGRRKGNEDGVAKYEDEKSAFEHALETLSSSGSFPSDDVGLLESAAVAWTDGYAQATGAEWRRDNPAEGQGVSESFSFLGLTALAIGSGILLADRVLLNKAKKAPATGSTG